MQVSRLGASLLLALGVPALIARDRTEYETLGVLFARAAAGEERKRGRGGGRRGGAGVAHVVRAVRSGRKESSLFDMHAKADDMFAAVTHAHAHAHAQNHTHEPVRAHTPARNMVRARTPARQHARMWVREWACTFGKRRPAHLERDGK